MRRFRSMLAAVGVALVAAACSPKPVVSVMPSRVTVAAGSVHKFSGIIGGMQNAWVTYAVEEGLAGGVIDETGLYTAPEQPGTYHIVVTSVADPSRFAVASVIVTPPPPVSVEISPDNVTLGGGSSMQFVAQVTGTNNVAVEWSVEEAGGGTIDATGVYLAPPEGGNFTIRATSVADRTRFDRETVSVFSAVRGLNHARYVTAPYVETIVPQDMRGTAIAAHVLDGASNSVARGAIGKEDGSFYVPNVPFQQFHLEVTETQSLVTSGRYFELGDYFLGRPDVEPAPPGSQLRIFVDGVAPWQTGDWFALTIPGVGMGNHTLVPGLFDGATELDVTLDYNSLIGSRGARGLPIPSDAVTVHQMEQQVPQVNVFEAVAATHALTTSGVRMANGEVGYAGGTLEPLPMRTADLMFEGWFFQNYTSAVSPSASAYATMLGISARMPSTLGELRTSLPSPDLFYASLIPSWNSDRLQYQYGNPFPGWVETVWWSAVYQRQYSARLPSGFNATPMNAFGQIAYEELKVSSGIQPLGVRISPVQSPSVDGWQFFFDSSISQAPVVSWAPPAVGFAGAYDVLLYRIEPTESEGTRRTLIATFTTQDTFLAIPRGVVSFNSQYSITIRAHASGSFVTHPNATQLPTGYADAMSGLLSVF